AARRPGVGVRHGQGSARVVVVSKGKIDLVCFDLGRVLMRICDGWEHACEVAGIAPPEKPFDASSAMVLHDIVVRSEIGAIDLEEFAAAAGPILGLSHSDVCALSNAYPLGAYPGAEELLCDLIEAGLNTACVSNTNVNHCRIMYDASTAS